MKLKLLIFFFWVVPTLANAQDQTPQPVFKIGTGMARIWFPDYRNIESARIEMSDFSQANYVLLEFTVTVLSNETKTYKTIKNIGSKLSDETKKIFSSLRSYDTILFEDISALDPSGKTVYLADSKIRVR